MADEGKAPIIIIKKKISGGHGGHHGGAWKVAYADFVTAMMAFFLVMWLMAVDEDTKAAISHYFNHPNTPYKAGRDPASDAVHPMGEKTGQGDNALAGAEGGLPADLVDEPIRPVNEDTRKVENEQLSSILKQTLENQAYGFEVNVDYLKFSVTESLLFKPGTTTLKPTAAKYLDRVGRIIQHYKGFISIAGHTDGNTPHEAAYEFSLSQAVTVMHYFIDRTWASEEKMFPQGDGDRRKFTQDKNPESREKNRRIEFTLSRNRDF